MEKIHIYTNLCVYEYTMLTDITSHVRHVQKPDLCHPMWCVISTSHIIDPNTLI